MYRNFNNDYYGNGFCHGFSSYNNGWSFFVGIGIVIIIAFIIFYLVNNKKKKTSNAAAESLKMKYVQGEITEEEYIRRKQLIEM